MKRPILAAALFALAAPAAAQPAASSRYTDLGERACRTVEKAGENDGDWTRATCPGTAGWGLVADYADARESLRVVSPGGRESDLQLWNTVGNGFSSLGPRAEWRGRGTGSRFRPHALIVRYNLTEGEGRPKSHLVVARLAPGPVCVVGVVPPGPRQNETARRLADRAAAAPCRR